MTQKGFELISGTSEIINALRSASEKFIQLKLDIYRAYIKADASQKAIKKELSFELKNNSDKAEKIAASLININDILVDIDSIIKHIQSTEEEFNNESKNCELIIDNIINSLENV